MYALTAVMISIAGIDKGAPHRIVANQLDEMHKVGDEGFESVWQRFGSQSEVDGDGLRMVGEWRQHWSNEIVRDCQIIYATFFPKHVPNYAFKKLMGGNEPKLSPKGWPVLEEGNNTLSRMMGNAEAHCAGNPLPMKGQRWNPIMSLLHGRLSPIMYVMLISGGISCSVCDARRTFGQMSMRSIRSAQAGDPMVCLVCEGVGNELDQIDGKDENAVGELVRQVRQICDDRGIDFKPEEWPQQDQYDKEKSSVRVIMGREIAPVASTKKEEYNPMEVPEIRKKAMPSDSGLDTDDELFAWLKLAVGDLSSELRTSHALLTARLGTSGQAHDGDAVKLITAAKILG